MSLGSSGHALAIALQAEFFRSLRKSYNLSPEFRRTFRTKFEDGRYVTPGPLDINEAGADALFLGIDLVAFWVFVWLAENNFYMRQQQRDHDDNWQNPSPDEDVVEEEKRVALSNPETDF